MSVLAMTATMTHWLTQPPTSKVTSTIFRQPTCRRLTVDVPYHVI